MSIATQKTLAALRETTVPWVVERWVGPPKFGKRIDLFGFIDIVALPLEQGKVLGVQSCGQSFSGHDKKILTDCRELAVRWLMCGCRLQLWGWRKLKVKRGGKAVRWTPRIKEYSLADFVEADACSKATP